MIKSNVLSDSMEPLHQEATNLVDLARAHALNSPDQVAYIFLPDRDDIEQRISYQALDRRARAIAAFLQKHGETGDRVLLAYPPGLNFIIGFFACLYAGMIAVPTYPPSHPRKWPRFEAIARDCNARILCADNTFYERTQANCQNNNLKNLVCINTDRITENEMEDWYPPNISEHSLAFLQYTSGTTGNPKGVMLSHGNLLQNERMIQRLYCPNKQSVVVGWLPLYHDMGLIGMTLQPFFCGFPAIILSPISVLQKPIRWLQAISTYQATTSGAPNFAYDLCVRRITPEQKIGLDLRCWDVAFSGAERVRSETLQRFAEYFSDCGFNYNAFMPCYGLAETTLLVTGKPKYKSPVVRNYRQSALERHRVEPPVDQENDSISLVSCGPTNDGSVVIVDPERKLEVSGVGEIWVRGGHVAQGYWGRPELSNTIFHAQLADSNAGPFLRTGDLGFIEDGELFIMGRRKELIIIRGRNFYPQDIEQVAQASHPSLHHGAAAAFSIERDGEERLIVMLEVGKAYVRNAAVDEIIAEVRLALAAQLEVSLDDAVLVKPASIPHTSSGKTQRGLCRERYLKQEIHTISVCAEPA